MDIVVRNIQQDFVVVTPTKDVAVEKFDATLYERIGKNYNGFSGHELVAAHTFESDWATWEMHPNGDEIVLLLSGRISFDLQLPAGQKSVELKEPFTYIIVPKGVWHTARTSTKSSLLFVTPGEGTQNKEFPGQ